MEILTHATLVAVPPTVLARPSPPQSELWVVFRDWPKAVDKMGRSRESEGITASPGSADSRQSPCASHWNQTAKARNLPWKGPLRDLAVSGVTWLNMGGLTKVKPVLSANQERMPRGGETMETMYRIVISALILGLLSGCAQTPVHSGGPEPFWGYRTEPDGTEYFRMGDILIMTRDGKSR